ncbi:MAG: hypothetical protein JO179_06155, partial [Solirubrobacterales bacterium]|nr:hypothetical protein [Solirubrobacterales bacterium]
VSRASVRRLLPSIKLSSSILGHPVSFTASGDVRTGLPSNGVTVFKILSGTNYKLVYG